MKKPILILILIILDQLTKLLFMNKSFSIINYTTNTGIAFSFLQGNNTILAIITILIILVMIYLLKTQKQYSLGLSFLIAGALGNLIDRLYFGFIRDFIDFKIWPIFNLADLFNIIGVILILYKIYKK